jgi:hypothetical protein
MRAKLEPSCIEHCDHWRDTLSRVEEIIAEQFANHSFEVIPNGYRRALAFGTTQLTFRPVVSGPRPLDVSHIATVETHFVENIPDLSRAELARLNRRSAFGSFYRADDGIRSKATYSIYKDEPNPEWVAAILSIVFMHQQPFGIGIAQAELSDELARANRASLKYPRNWTRSVTPEAFEAVAERLREAGYISSIRPHGLVLEVTLAEGGPSSILDRRSETALLHVSTDIRHPLGGVGYLGTLALPIDPPRQHIVEWCEYLNAEEHKQEDFAPRLGAWGVRGISNKLVYAVFLASDRDDPNVIFSIATWLIWRALWIKQAFWVAGWGLHRSADERNG